MHLRAGIAAVLLVISCLACSAGSAQEPAQPQPEPVLPDLSQAVESPPAAAPAPPAPAPVPVAKTRKVVVLDPGHGADEVGSAANGVVEKDSNLDMALRVEKLLATQGVDVVLTRRSDTRASPQVDGYTATRSDLQARLDLANEAGGDVFVSLHSNGSTDPAQRGVEAWYDSDRGRYSAEGKQLARLLVDNVIRELGGFGYNAVNRGLYDGHCFRERMGRCFTLFVIAGARETSREEVLRRGGDPEVLGFKGADRIFSRPADMPAALLETLIVTNPADAAVLRQPQARDAIARGISKAILQFLGLPYQG
jgi:N-acetylmuramoyl-L-alanine amidase